MLLLTIRKSCYLFVDNKYCIILIRKQWEALKNEQKWLHLMAIFDGFWSSISFCEGDDDLCPAKRVLSGAKWLWQIIFHSFEYMFDIYGLFWASNSDPFLVRGVGEIFFLKRAFFPNILCSRIIQPFSISISSKLIQYSHNIRIFVESDRQRDSLKGCLGYIK